MTTAATATGPAPSPLNTVKRPRPVSWRNQSIAQPSTDAPTAPSPAQSITPDDDIFTVGAGTSSKSPEVDPGVHRVVLTDLVKETGDNPFEPGQQRTVFIFTFALANAPDQGTWRYYTGVSMKSQKLAAVLTALKMTGTSFKKAEVLGREAQALIERTERGFTRIANLFPA